VVGYAIAQAAPGESNGYTCDQWIVQPTQAGAIKASAADGYLFCATTGELWQIDADKKRHVNEEK
jgi:hypothetical protein